MKYEVDTRKKTTKDLESKLVALERRHWEAAGRAEDTKKELERKHVDKVFSGEMFIFGKIIQGMFTRSSRMRV